MGRSVTVRDSPSATALSFPLTCFILRVGSQLLFYCGWRGNELSSYLMHWSVACGSWALWTVGPQLSRSSVWIPIKMRRSLGLTHSSKFLEKNAMVYLLFNFCCMTALPVACEIYMVCVILWSGAWCNNGGSDAKSSFIIASLFGQVGQCVYATYQHKWVFSGDSSLRSQIDE